jgi:Ca2+:H+ antiporter
MVAPANLVGFAGQELARKIPKVYGVLMETTLGSIVEIVLFMVLLKKDDNNNLIPVIQAAILGSILANLLLCLGLCFFIGGIRKGRKEQEFDEAISEVGSGLLLVAGLGLLVPSAFYGSLNGTGLLTDAELLSRDLTVSRITALLLFVAFCL